MSDPLLPDDARADELELEPEPVPDDERPLVPDEDLPRAPDEERPVVLDDDDVDTGELA